MKRVLLRFWSRLLRRFGPPGIVGLLVLAAAATVTALLPGMERSTREADAAMLDAQRIARTRPVTARPVSVSQADALRAFVAGFPSMKRNAADIGTVFDAADHHHVVLAKGEYQLKDGTTGEIVAYTATFPIHGDYQSLTDFSAEVLTALPHAAMDELRISRDTSASPSLDAVVRFTIYYRNR